MNPERHYLENQGETSNLPLQQRAAEALFGDVRFRPTAQTVASLIEQGLTEDDILAAGHLKGYKTPIMDETLRDLDVALPYIQQISDRIAQDHGDDILWLAARDFEAVADDLMIRYPHLEAYLVPASQDLLSHETMFDKNLAARFLGHFGLTAANAVDPRKKFAVFDSGFQGTIGQRLDHRAELLHGVSLNDAGRLTNKLVSVNTKYSAGEQIMDFPGGADNFSEELLPRANRFAGTMHTEDFSDTHMLAVFLQTLPRFHDAYGKLIEFNGSIVALPRVCKNEAGMVYELIDNNIDRPIWGEYNANASIVNPLAAAVVMYRVVKSALEQRGISSKAFSDLQSSTAVHGRDILSDMPLVSGRKAPSHRFGSIGI